MLDVLALTELQLKPSMMIGVDRPEPIRPLLGFNTPWDLRSPVGTAGDWLREQGIESCLYIPWPAGFMPGGLDFWEYQDDGQFVIVNLRHSWGRTAGEGTFPALGDNPEGVLDMHAVVWAEIIQRSQGVSAWTFYNELTNPREQPEGELIDPETAAEAIVRIVREAKPGMWAIGAVDPTTNWIGMLPNDYLRLMYDRCDELGCRPTFIDLHGYIRGPDPQLVYNRDEFEWMPHHALNYFAQIETQLAALPEWTRGMPVCVSECNHLWRTIEGDWGWVTDDRAANIVAALWGAAREWNMRGANPIRWICLYRWWGDCWSVADIDAILGTTRDIGNTSRI